MFLFLIEVIIVSILVSIFASWIGLIPAYPKLKYRLMQQLCNTAVLTVILSLMFSFGIYPSWVVLFLVILFILWISVRTTSFIVKNEGETFTREH